MADVDPTGLPEDTAPTSDDFGYTYDSGSGVLKRTTWQNLVKAIGPIIMPIGFIYSNATDSTDPATKFGFGTWTAIHGYTLVGYKSGDSDFGTLGEVAAGEKTHQLTVTEMPSHLHTYATGFDGGASGLFAATAGSGYAGTHIRGTNSGVNTSSAGGDGAHNNIQPSYVVYMWERTA